MTIGFALCGSYCTYDRVFPVIEALSKENKVIPILSEAAYATDSRFGTAEHWKQKLEEICGCPPLHLISQVEPIGPKGLLDILVIAPCTGNTLAKLAHSIADGPVTMAAKSHLRNGRPVLIAVSTNDGLAGAGENIGRLLARKHYYFVPFGQDDPLKKPTSLIADFARIPQAMEGAMAGQQIQPMLL
ncbi:MAG: dipicolinate synthase subunit B [Clostridiales bacterium]|nr:dipicolinate synthase subunit B [Clostridiales bacterium]